MIELVLLDAGGVVLDERESEAARAALTAEVLSAVAPGYSVDDYHRDVAEAVAAFCPNAYDFVLWRRTAPDVERFETLRREIAAEWTRREPPLRLMPGIGLELKALQGRYRVGLAGQYGRGILDVLAAADLLRCFAHPWTRENFPVTKPDPRFYTAMAAAAGVRPEDCLMIGDRIDKDVEPAKALGMGTIRVRGGLHDRQRPRTPAEIPDRELPSVAGLAAAVESLR